MLTRPWKIVCPKCKSPNLSKDTLDKTHGDVKHDPHVA